MMMMMMIMILIMTFQAERNDVDIVYGLVDQPQFWNPLKHQVGWVEMLGGLRLELDNALLSNIYFYLDRCTTMAKFGEKPCQWKHGLTFLLHFGRVQAGFLEPRDWGTSLLWQRDRYR